MTRNEERMTIEEMIELLDVTRREWSAYVDGFDSKEHEKFDQIIAAIRAGQAMREGCQVYQLDMGGNHTYHTNSVTVNKFVKAWDAAVTEGNVGEKE